MRPSRALMLVILAASAALAQPGLTPAQILTKVGARYRHPRRYYFAATVRNEDLAGENELVFAYERPDKFRIDAVGSLPDLLSGMLPAEETGADKHAMILVDGHSTWLYFPDTKRYSRSPGGFKHQDRRDPESRVKPATAADFASHMDDLLLGRYRTWTKFARYAKVQGTATVALSGKQVPCYIVRIGVNAEGNPSDAEFRAWWVAQDTYFVLREEVTIPGNSSTTVFTRVAIGEPLPPGLFTFTPPPDAKPLDTKPAATPPPPAPPAGNPPASAPATSVPVGGAWGIATDASGNVYFSSYEFSAVFKLDNLGIVTRVAGRGVPGFSGDGGPAIDASLDFPQGVAVDRAGNLYIVDSGNQRIRKVTASTGIIATVAGSGAAGYSGDGGPATGAQLNRADDVAVDAAGNLYVADTENHRVRKIDASTGIITTVAGEGAVPLGYPQGVAVDPTGNVLIADLDVRKLNVSTGLIATVDRRWNNQNPGANRLAVSAHGDLYILDTFGVRVFKVDSDGGAVTVVAGSGARGYSGDGGPAPRARLYTPFGIAVDNAGNIYIADTWNSRIRKVDVKGDGMNV